MSNTDFLVALPEDRALRKTCLRCHAPTTLLTQDFDLSEPLTREGIICDFCHSVEKVDLTLAQPYVLDVGSVKRGPLKNPGIPPHGVVVSPLHQTSEFCAGCHEFENRHGVKVLSNYSEWQAGPMARLNVTCQGCHMEIYRAKVVFFQDTEEVPRTFINLHTVPGGRSKSQLVRAVDLGIDEIQDREGEVLVAVTIDNKGAGHAVPGGMANRALRLEVTLRGDRWQQNETRVYERVLGNGNGKPVLAVASMFTDATQVLSDTRIQAGEKRVTRFLFPRISRPVRIEARLLYVVRGSTELMEVRETEIAHTGRDL